MKYLNKLNEDNKLIIYFENELNSANSEKIDLEIEKIITDDKHYNDKHYNDKHYNDKNYNDKHYNVYDLIFDFQDLKYITSAGLRVILKYKKKFDSLSIINACLEVYDILDMTGFTNFMKVTKALKEVDVTCCKVIGEGFFSTVYRLNKDTIIKVFNRTSDAMQIERELKLAKRAFILGIPTAISFDIVKVGEKLGVRFEMLDCMSLKNCFVEDEANYDDYVNRYVKLLKKINNTLCDDNAVPYMKDAYLNKVDCLKDDLDIANYKKIRTLIEDIPDSINFIHGDCHFKNIMVQGDDYLIIDMDTLSRGYYIFELASLRASYIGYEEDEPGNCERFLGVTSEFSSKLYYDVLYNYLSEMSEERINKAKSKIELLSFLHMVWWTKLNEKDNEVRLNGCMNRLLNVLPKVDTLII